MAKAITLFSTVLLMIILTSGTKSDNSTLSYYYIYSLNVNIPTYYCIYENNYDCRTFKNNSEVVTKYSEDIKYYCEHTLQSYCNRVKNAWSWFKLKLTVCRVKTLANLLDNTVHISKDQTCKYSDKKCYDRDSSRNAIWNNYDICSSYFQVYKGTFQVCRSDPKQIYIYAPNISLLLTKEIVICDHKVWKTDYPSIFVSRDPIGQTVANFTINVHSTPPANCKEAAGMTKKSVTNTKPKHLPQKWYVYEYPVNITAIFCVINSNKSCEDMAVEFKSENNDLVEEECRKKFCDPFCKSISLCSKVLMVDLEKDRILELPEECKYSDGICNQSRTLWSPTDRCKSIQRVHEGYGSQYEHIKNTIVLQNSSQISLTRKGMICKKQIWLTYEMGRFASTEKLNFSLDDPTPTISSRNSDQLDSITNENKKSTEITLTDKINNLELRTYWLALFALVCLGFYVFNVIVNFFTLKKFGKRAKLKDKPCCMSCFSQSLTTRYISLSQKVVGTQASQLYETVENELYNK